LVPALLCIRVLWCGLACFALCGRAMGEGLQTSILWCCYCCCYFTLWLWRHSCCSFTRCCQHSWLVLLVPLLLTASAVAAPDPAAAAAELHLGGSLAVQGVTCHSHRGQADALRAVQVIQCQIVIVAVVKVPGTSSHHGRQGINNGAQHLNTLLHGDQVPVSLRPVQQLPCVRPLSGSERQSLYCCHALRRDTGHAAAVSSACSSCTFMPLAAQGTHCQKICSLGPVGSARVLSVSTSYHAPVGTPSRLALHLAMTFARKLIPTICTTPGLQSRELLSYGHGRQQITRLHTVCPRASGPQATHHNKAHGSGWMYHVFATLAWLQHAIKVISSASSCSPAANAACQ
jgi:hypothetical protein